MTSTPFRLLLLVGLTLAWIPEALAQSNPGTIFAKRVRGTVTYQNNGETTLPAPVVENMALAENTTLTTAADSSVVLVFSNGATLNLGSDTVLNIQEYKQDPFAFDFSPGDALEEPSVSVTRLTLTRGELVGKVATLHHDQGSEFTINTPVGAAGIRGTTFRIVYRPDGTGQAFYSLTTIEGNVEVTLATGTVNTPVSVTDNEEVVLAEIIIDIDDVTGEVTVTTLGGDVIPIPISAVDAQDVVTRVQEIAQALAAVVITSGGNLDFRTGNTDNNSQTNEGEAPPPTTEQPRTTSGDGR